SNIIMAANQAADVTEDKDIIVLPTTSIPQGLSACIGFNPEADAETNRESMMDAVSAVTTGSITYAIKDTTVDGIEIHDGDYMGIMNKDIVVTGKEMLETAKGLIDKLCDEDSEIITLIKGEDATEEDVNALEAYINDNYDVDVDIEDGGQPVYCFIIGVE
ncbi:MAG TPA: hypothetical protein DHW39_03445, partial [Erysipelotrichaceae bacterium]|nr:hypothetical protein [Erysipelotrichaceae bacterium]